MASFSPRCEIRQLAVFVYPGGIKAPDAERITVFYGRRGRPVKKPRFIPAELAHQWARKLQARRVSSSPGLSAALNAATHSAASCAPARHGKAPGLQPAALWPASAPPWGPSIPMKSTCAG